MPYLARLVDELRSSYPLPEARVCMTGMSGGARMSCHFAWLRADAVRMAGAVAGLRAVTAEPPTRPVPVLAFHGTADRINPYGGSGTARWDESVPDAARRWGVGNGVASEPEEVAVTRTLTRTTYGHEGDPGEVTLWTSRGAGHTWPGGRLGLVLRLLLGRTSQEIDATAQISSFAQVERGQPGRG
jgi:polyhydroxybutyrate depolymerase